MNKRPHTLYAAAMLALSAAAFAPAIAATQVDYVMVAPPRFERVPQARVGYVWAPGYWEWRRHRHEWMAGSWIAERPGYLYAAPRWVQRDGHWLREEAHWERHEQRMREHGRGDRDHDGVPDRYDHDRDGDGISNRHDRHPDNPHRD